MRAPLASPRTHEMARDLGVTLGQILDYAIVERIRQAPGGISPVGAMLFDQAFLGHAQVARRLEVLAAQGGSPVLSAQDSYQPCRGYGHSCRPSGYL